MVEVHSSVIVIGILFVMKLTNPDKHHFVAPKSSTPSKSQLRGTVSGESASPTMTSSFKLFSSGPTSRGAMFGAMCAGALALMTRGIARRHVQHSRMATKAQRTDSTPKEEKIQVGEGQEASNISAGDILQQLTSAAAKVRMAELAKPVINKKIDFVAGQRVKSNKSGRDGMVVGTDSEGHPHIVFDGRSKELFRMRASEFVIIRNSDEDEMRDVWTTLLGGLPQPDRTQADAIFSWSTKDWE